MAKKCPKCECPAGEKWAVPFADFLSLLLALFIALYALASVNVEKQKALKEEFMKIYSYADTNSMEQSDEEEKAKTNKESQDDIEGKAAAADEAINQLEQLEQKNKNGNLEEVEEGTFMAIPAQLLFEQGKAELTSQYAPAFLSRIAKLFAVMPEDTEINVKGYAEDSEVKNSKYQDALELDEKTNIFRTDEFQNGWFEVQDAGSQLIAPYLRVQPGMRVVDACAGAGGKTLHLASLMENKGQIIAMDLYEWKLKELKRRAKRNNVQNVQTKIIEAKTIKRMENSADRLLIDAPCSGMGVLKRNPDAKWKLQPHFIDEIIATQAKILADYSKVIKVGGLMVYATCSILPQENEQQVEKFLANHPNYKLISDKMHYPSETNYDGFYMALIERIA